MDALRRRYLEVMGIPLYARRGGGAGDPGGGDAGAGVPAAAQDGRGEELAGMAQTVSGCTRCGLCRGRTQTVFGVGSPCADWMVIGEAPGAEEDRQGEPFVGRAGKLLNAMLRAAGLERAEVYITNIVKCRPPGNRDPRPEEAAACEAYLRRQIELVRPRVILAAGRVAAQNLLNRSEPLGRMRGRRYTYRGTGVPVVVTYHPAYLLRSPGQKRRAWEDLKLAGAVAREKR